MLIQTLSQFRTPLFFALLIGLSSSPCSKNKSDEMVPFGPDVEANLVIYFKSDVTEKQINDFWRGVLQIPHPEGRGHGHREGIRGILRVYPPVQNHEALAVTFLPNATQAQRDDIKSRALSSPLVYKVLENVAPKDVKKIN